MWILDRMVDWWIQRCRHDSRNVTFDLLERTVEIHNRVFHCRRCGAVRLGNSPEWRRPRPLWHPEY